jgi:transcriptional regulator with XRE-family HTH domain
MRGYSYEFVKKIRALAKSSQAPEAVQLASKAIERGIPIIRIADRVGVSRMTVYDWFTGKYEPTPQNLRKLKAYITGKSA